MGIAHLAGFSGLLTGLVIVGVLAMIVQQPAAAARDFSAGADVITGVTHGMEGKN